MAKIGEDRKGEVEKFMLKFTWSNSVTRYFISLQCSGHSILWRFYRVCCSWQGCGSKVSVSCLMLNQRFIPTGVEQISTDVRAVCFVWFCACSVQHLALLQKRVGYAVNQSKHQKMLVSFNQSGCKTRQYQSCCRARHFSRACHWFQVFPR